MWLFVLQIWPNLAPPKLFIGIHLADFCTANAFRLFTAKSNETIIVQCLAYIVS